MTINLVIGCRRACASLLIALVAVSVVACGNRSTPTPTTIEAAIQLTPSPTYVSADVPVQVPPTVTTSSSEASTGSFVGRYRMRSPSYEHAADADYYLVLNEDNTARYEEDKIGGSEIEILARGTWRIDGNGVIIELTELLGQPVTKPEVLKYEYVDGFPVATEYQAGDVLFNVAQARFSIGAGERHPLMRELHQRLARIDYLNFTDPGPESDVYSEETRKAIVRFQKAQGLIPDGVVNGTTWVLLGNPPPPVPTPTPIPLSPSAKPIVTTTDDLNARSGPGTQFDVRGTIPQGTSLKITGRNADSTWLQVPYPNANSRAWISAQFVTVSGDLESVSAVGAGSFGQEATPVAGASPPAIRETPKTDAPDLGKLRTHTEDGKPIVYLTFDDGPSAFTQQILDLMAQYDGECTFFVLGNLVKSNRDLVRAAASAGHYIANHTNSHISLSGVTLEQFMVEIEETRQAILEVAVDVFTLDKDVKYLRPPYGATDANTRNYANSLGYAVVLWDIDPQDWRRPGADVIASHIINSVYPGAIVLMHDGGGERSQTVAALERVLRELSGQGYVFKNVFVVP